MEDVVSAYLLQLEVKQQGMLVLYLVSMSRENCKLNIGTKINIIRGSFCKSYLDINHKQDSEG